MNYFIYRIKHRIWVYFYQFIMIPICWRKNVNKIKKYHIKSIQDTILKLVNSNESLGRFGDGEIEWLIGNKKKFMSFEKNSPLLRKCLLKVLNTNNKKFLIGLPDALRLPDKFTHFTKLFWKIILVKYNKKFLKYLNPNKIYYNTSVTRPYIDYNCRKIATKTFKAFKELWKNKNLLIVEGKDSRVGAVDDLFKNTNDIKRIECPIKNAFESYNKIAKATLTFLKNSSKTYITLISLGPTATILSYDICKKGYRAIDIGHLDLEYEWYLIGAKEKINLPYQYVNENIHGHSALPVKNSNYNKEIIKIIN